MLVLRGTKKLRDRLKGAGAGVDDASTTVLGYWFATALFWRPQVALLVNERTLLPVFLPLAPASTLPTRLPSAIASMLRRHGADEAFIASELVSMSEVRISPTNNRSVVGVMNEFSFHGELLFHEGEDDLEELSFRMASLILGPLDNRGGSPDRALALVLNAGGADVIPFPERTARERAGLVSVPTVKSYELKVTLREIRPPVWRRVVVDGSVTLDQLHEVIQAAFGWWNYHLYEFQIGRVKYGIPDPDWDFGPPTKPANRAVLATVAKAGTTFRYSYDFGDGWEHDITVEKTEALEAAVQVVPACIDGLRACPPEDCGGPWGYQQLLEILADPSHPEHGERVQWVGEWGGGRLDPEAFDPREFTDNVKAVRKTDFGS